jgi:hypothetical protein
MTNPHPKDMASSVRHRLAHLAHQRKEDFQFLLSRYAAERLIYRIEQSAYQGQFILKGAMLFQLWSNSPYRATRDIDLLAHGDPSVMSMENTFRTICNLSVEDDGVIFQADSVVGRVIRPDQAYTGVRIQLQARLERARIPVQIDIGFGDIVTPGPQSLEFPSLLGFPTPRVPTYPRETVIAEKFQAMIALGISNSRLKDYYDLWVLSQKFQFDGHLIARAIAATFARRETQLPAGIPIALTEEFCEDDAKQKQWKAFLKKAKLDSPRSLSEVAEHLQSFLLPPSNAAGVPTDFVQTWTPPGPWRNP